VTNSNRYFPDIANEYVCDECGFWFITPEKYTMFGCGRCGRGVAFNNGKINILKVEEEKEYITDGITKRKNR